MRNVLSGKKIVIGITGSIAAFKVAGWVSSLVQDGADVNVLMTDAAEEFVGPLTFSALSGKPVLNDMFASEQLHSISHIELGQNADLVCIAPATANTIAKLSCGMADDLISTTVLAATCPVMIVPAMNSRMYINTLTQANIQKLKGAGYTVVEPETGKMACGSEGPGRLPEWKSVAVRIQNILSRQDLAGEKILITAGPTREPLDPARFLSNRSSGRMGYALAEAARRRGADVTLVSGPTSLDVPYGVKMVSVQTAAEMYEAVTGLHKDASVIIKAAAVSDFRPAVFAKDKVKKEGAEMCVDLELTTDILKELGQQKENFGYLLVGFAAESCDLLNAGRKKLSEKNLDLIALNDISNANTGFESVTNQVTLLDKNGTTELPLTSKDETADLILDRVVSLLSNK